jgi:hypothetical protein
VGLETGVNRRERAAALSGFALASRREENYDQEGAPPRPVLHHASE